MDWDPATDDLMQDCVFPDQLFLVNIGIALENRCQLPIIPTDLFPRELSEIIDKPYARVKIIFDVLCLATTGLFNMSDAWIFRWIRYWNDRCCHLRWVKWFRSQAVGSIRELLLHRS